MINLGNHFSQVDESHSELARQRKWFIKARQDRQKQEDLADKSEGDTTALAVEVIIATEQQIRDFETKLDRYDETTVAALMENQKQLDAVNARIEDMLSRAYVMEDGRRVFKTRDGTKVFDEHDQFVSRDELDYDLIGPDLPIAEDFKQEKFSRKHFEARKEKLLEFQEEVDNAREEVSKNGTTQDNLEELEADLMKDVPEEVMAQMSGYGQSDLAQKAVTTKTQPTTLDIQASVPTPM